MKKILYARHRYRILIRTPHIRVGRSSHIYLEIAAAARTPVGNAIYARDKFEPREIGVETREIRSHTSHPASRARRAPEREREDGAACTTFDRRFT